MKRARAVGLYQTMRTTILLVGALGACAAEEATEHDEATARAETISWPSDSFPTLQEAIEAAPDGSTIRIAPGRWDLEAPLTVQGKRLHFRGAGIGSEGGTQLVGPAPLRVADPERARGLLQFNDAGGSVAELEISGFDAGVVSTDGPRRRSTDVVIDSVAISRTGYGVLWKGASKLTVKATRISGITADGLLILNGLLEMFDVEIDDVEDVGVFVETGGDCTSPQQNLIQNVTITNCAGGGVMVFRGGACVYDSVIATSNGAIWAVHSALWAHNNTLFSNRVVGIGIIQSIAWLYGNDIGWTLPHPNEPIWGDGVAIVADQAPAQVLVESNWIVESDRAGVSVFGSTVDLVSNTIDGSAFDLDVETWNGFSALVNDGGGNTCDGASCVAVGSQIEPPKPLD